MYSLKYMISKFLVKIQIPSVLNSKIHPSSKVCAKSHVVNSKIGKYSYIGYACNIYNVEIGSFCSIAERCFLGGAQHPVEFISTSPVFHKGKNILRKNFSEHDVSEGKKIVIGSDVWIGSGVFVKTGVKIGTGAVIGMGSVVTHDVEPYSIVAGNPAKLIRYRFEKNIREKIIETEWWNLEEEVLKVYSKYFNNPYEFLKLYKKKV